MRNPRSWHQVVTVASLMFERQVDMRVVCPQEEDASEASLDGPLEESVDRQAPKCDEDAGSSRRMGESRLYEIGRQWLVK